MTHRRLFIALSTAALVTVIAAGCASPPPPADKLDPAKSPLQVYMSAMYPNPDEEDYDAQQKDVESVVAACMAKEGFDYVPVDQSQYSGSPDDFEERDTKKWVAEHGYGMTQTPEEIEEQNQQAEEYVDPNQDYVNALSAGEQTAYYEVLYGVTPAEEELDEDGSYEYKWDEAGCQGFAQHEVNGDDPYASDENKALFDAMNSMYEDLQTSAALKKLNTVWAGCMADAGYPGHKAKAEAQQTLNDELNALYESQDEAGPDEEAMAALRKKEIAVALADFTCTKKTDYANVSLAAQFELEKQFIADHQAELDAMIASAEQGK